MTNPEDMEKSPESQDTSVPPVTENSSLPPIEETPLNQAAASSINETPSLGTQVGTVVDNLELNSYVTALKHVWKGETAQGIDLVDKIRNFWIVASGALVFLSAFVNTFFLARVSGQPGMGFLRFTSGSGSFLDLLDTRESYIGFSVGQFFELLFKYLLLIATIYCVRAGVLMLAAKVRKHNFSFTRALGLVSFAYLPTALLLLIIFALAIIPGSITLRLGIFILSATLIPLILFAELIMYIGLNQHNQIQKSALVPYTLFTGAGFLIVGLILGSLTTNFGG